MASEWSAESIHFEHAANAMVNTFEALDKQRRRILGDVAAGWIIHKRVKSADSIAKKIQRKRASGRADYSVADMTDLAGVRVIVESKSCANDLGSWVMDRCQVRKEQSENFSETPRADGYRGIHLIVEQPSPFDSKLSLPVEVQIRTVLQHQWAILSHSEFYKKASEIPPNLLARMRSLSEILNCADMESEHLRRGRMLDETGTTVGRMMANVLENLHGGGESSELIGRQALFLVEFERKLRRTLVSDGPAQDRAFRALGSLAQEGSTQMFSAAGDVEKQLKEIVRRVQTAVFALPSEDGLS